MKKILLIILVLLSAGCRDNVSPALEGDWETNEYYDVGWEMTDAITADAIRGMGEF